MVEVIPAIMPKSLDELADKVGLVKDYAPFVQVDIMDGVFVPETSWPFPNIAGETSRFKDESEGLPFWEDVSYEFDLMVKNPERYWDDFFPLGASRLIVHYESTTPESIREILKKAKETDTEFGIAIGFGTPPEVLEEFLVGQERIDFVQCMGIKKIGYQGESFDESVIPTVEKLRERHGDIIISVDGGVSIDSASRLVSAGVRRLVSGSAIFGSGDIAGVIHSLEELA